MIEEKSGCLECFKMKLSTLDKISCFLSELIGTGLLIFLGCMGCVQNETWDNNHFRMNFNFGLVVMIIIQCFGCVSGAHLNPAVTISACIYNLVTIPMAIAYMVAQCVGALIGYGLLQSVLTHDAIMAEGAAHGLCVTTIHKDITMFQGVTIEIIITAVLALVCCGVWDPRNAKHQDSVPIKFGLTIACLGLTASAFTGASMNPARSLGPALWNLDFTHLWVYWVAPIIGSSVATIAYKTVFRRGAKDEKLRRMEEQPLS